MLQFVIKWGAIIAAVYVTIAYPGKIVNVISTILNAVINFFVSVLTILLDIVAAAAERANGGTMLQHLTDILTAAVVG